MDRFLEFGLINHLIIDGYNMCMYPFQSTATFNNVKQLFILYGDVILPFSGHSFLYSSFKLYIT